MSRDEVSPLGGTFDASVMGDKVSSWDYPQGTQWRVPRLTAVTSELSPRGWLLTLEGLGGLAPWRDGNVRWVFL